MKPIVIAFVGEGTAADQIRHAEEAMGFEVQWMAEAPPATAAETAVPRRPGEMITGNHAGVFAWLVNLQPALVLFDLENEAIPWRRWMPALKSSPATRRIPVVGFAGRGQQELFEVAKGCGVDGVTNSERLAETFPQLWEKLARLPDYAAIHASCAEPLSAQGVKGLELFNKGEYYESHHALEAAWNEDQGAGRNLYKGILQVGVAYYQIERGNYNGAIKLILRMRQWLDPLPEVCRGVQVGQLRRDVAAVYEALQALGAERLGELDPNLLKPVVYVV